MPFVFSKILDHGTSHPVVARMQVQVSDLLKNTNFNETTREVIFKASFDASLRLIRCGDIQNKILAECDKSEREHQPGNNPQAETMPHIVGLQLDAENFLYEAKNFLRDLTVIINAVFGTGFDQASQFGKVGNARDSKIARWAERQFGPDDRLTKFFRLHQEWISEVVQMRNAVEHPDGYSGVLHIKNYELMPDGSICRPTWYRNDDSPSCMVDEMVGLCEQMLVLADELVALIVQRHLAAPILEVYEIPDEQRNPECPMSFRIGLTVEAAKQFEDQTKRGE
jgi:hypothetical protein